MAFAFSAVSAALDRLDPAYRRAAESAGAGPVRVLTGSRCRYCFRRWALGAAAALAVALSMGTSAPP
jgi:2-aminoethylphosphonate transport system permease protein